MMKGLKMTLKQKALVRTVKSAALFAASVAAFVAAALLISVEVVSSIMILGLIVYAFILVYEFNLHRLEMDERNTKE